MQEKKCADKKYSTESSRNCFKPFFFSVLYAVCGKKKDETSRTHAKKYLHSICSEIHSICSEIHADYVTLLFEKIFWQKEYKEHLFVYGL